MGNGNCFWQSTIWHFLDFDILIWVAIEEQSGEFVWCEKQEDDV